MKVVINAVSAKMGGAANYITSLLPHLSAIGADMQFRVFLPAQGIGKQEGLSENIQLVPTHFGHAKWWRRLWWEQVTLRRFLRKETADTLFSSANFGMFRCPVRQVLLVRNSLYFSKIYQDTFLAKHSIGAKVAFCLRRWLICQSVRSADVVMTPTQAMLDDLRRFVEVGPEKVLVNPYGVVSHNGFFQQARAPMDRMPPEPERMVRLVYVSLYAEHKNLNTLLKALPLLNRNGARNFVLKTTANPAWEEARRTVTHKHDLALLRRREIAECVHFVGPLQSEQTQELYRNADIFVFPSLTESFGHPMAEAMAYGLPIVASDTPVNREICGEAAVYFSPISPEGLAAQVYQVASDGALRQKLSDLGRQRATSRFRWSEHVRRILDTARLLSSGSEGAVQPEMRKEWSYRSTSY